MKKKVVVKSLKSLAIAATLAFGISAFGATADAAIIPEKAPVKTVDPEAMDESVITYSKSSLLSIGLGGSLLEPLLGKVQVDVVGQKDVKTTKGTLSTGGLVQADITDSQLLGNTHVGVAEKTVIETDDYKYSYSGLAQVDIEGSIIGDAHVGLVEDETVETDQYKHSRSNLALVELDTPLTGKISVPVGDKEEFERKDGSGGDDDNGGGDDNGNGKDDDNGNGGGDDNGNGGGDDNGNGGGDDNGNGGGDDNGAGNGGDDDTLPVTGSAMDSTLLVIASLLMMAAGFAVRMFNFKRA